MVLTGLTEETVLFRLRQTQRILEGNRAEYANLKI